MRRPYPIVGGVGEVFREDFRSSQSVAENGGQIIATPTIKDGMTVTADNTQAVIWPGTRQIGRLWTQMSVLLRFRTSSGPFAGNYDKHLYKVVNVGTDASWIIRREQATSFNFYVATTVSSMTAYGYTNAAPVADTEYWHLWVYNGSLAAGSRLALYSDGVAGAITISGTIPTSLTTGDQPIASLCSSDNLSHASLTGTIMRQIRIWNRALSAEEALDLYQGDTMTELQP